MLRRLPAGLLLILALGTALRLYRVGDPYLDAHRWRQVDTAAIARNFHDGSLHPLYPRVDWGGVPGHVEAEFPLVPWLAALAWRVTGPSDAVGRGVVIAFAVLLIWATWRLARTLDAPPAAALAAAFLVAISPAAVFFGRTLMPDTPMLTFSVLALIGFLEYARRGARGWLAAGSAALALAILVKIPAVFVVPAIAAGVLGARGPAAWRDARLWVAAAVPLVVSAAWYWHAHALFRETGLTFGILGAPAKTYPAYISTGPWPSVFSKWSTWALVSDPAVWERLVSRLYHFVLLPVGAVGAVAGAFLWRGPGRRVVLAWLGSLAAFVLVAIEGHRAHEYYQLPFAVVGALLAGAAFRPAFDRAWLDAVLGGRGGRAAFAAAIAAAGLLAFYYSGVTQTHFRVGGLDVRLAQAGRAIGAATEDGALAVVVDDYGVTSPLLFYFSRLKGWAFDPADVSPALLQRLRRFGARYFATMQWSEVVGRRPEVGDLLALCEEIALDDPPRDTRLFDLGCLR